MRVRLLIASSLEAFMTPSSSLKASEQERSFQVRQYHLHFSKSCSKACVVFSSGALPKSSGGHLRAIIVLGFPPTSNLKRGDIPHWTFDLAT